MTTIFLNGTNLTITDLNNFLNNPDYVIEIDPKAKQEVSLTKQFIDQQAGGKIIYGINTGFGPMASHVISDHQQLDLQRNLIRSHAVGAGDPIKSSYVLAAMIVRLNTLLQGHSGVSVELIERLQTFINHRITPIIPEHGAVGTSGDLVQLAHIALAIIGEGEVIFDNKRQPTQEVLAALAIPPTYELQPKEGLALINGTSVMTGIAATLCIDAKRLLDAAVGNGAFSLELVHAYDDGISEQLHNLRPHAGQKEVARSLRDLLKDSKLLRSRSSLHETVKAQDDVLELPQAIQEVYSLRCIPQILGPIQETITKTINTVEIELNAVTDNPIIDRELGEFLHGGNFHGDYIASAVDQLKAALVKLTMLSERRVNFFLNKNVNKFFPPFLNLKKPGLTLGLQGMQFVATSTTAQSQSLAYPHHLHSIPTNGDNQDVVSMGTDAALLAAKVIENAFIVVAIERISLAQAADFTKENDLLSQASLNAYRQLRTVFPAVIEDRAFSPEIGAVVGLLKQGS